MKSQLQPKQTIKSGNFPKLMYLKEDKDLVVLFWSINQGIVVSSNVKENGGHYIGHVFNNWDDYKFEYYEGNVILTN